MKTVTFCGHSRLCAEDVESLKNQLFKETEKLICHGANTFLLGGYGEFDLLCAHVVKSLKQKYPHIMSVLVIPYLNRDYDKSLYDRSFYPSIEDVPPRYAIVERNNYMVDVSDVIIAFVEYGYGGAHRTYRYAVQKGKPIIKIQSNKKDIRF